MRALEQARPALRLAVMSKFILGLQTTSSSMLYVAVRVNVMPSCCLCSPTQIHCVLSLQTMWTAELRRRLRDDGHVLAVAIHPGEVLTNVTRSTPTWVQQCYRALWIILLTPPQGEDHAHLKPLLLAEASALLLPGALVPRSALANLKSCICLTMAAPA